MGRSKRDCFHKGAERGGGPDCADFDGVSFFVPGEERAGKSKKCRQERLCRRELDELSEGDYSLARASTSLPRGREMAWTLARSSVVKSGPAVAANSPLRLI